jgi:AraC-like DNA-binding protein
MMPADPLSDVLKNVRMTGATFFNVTARSPWVAEQCSPEMVLPLILPGAEHMISYHIVTEGSCFACLLGGDSDPIEVHAGQVIVFTRGDAHVMSSEPGLRAEPVEPDALAGVELPYVVSFGEEGPATVKVICGFLACDSGPFNPLLENLPPILIGESRRDDGTIPCLAPLIRFAMNEVRDRRIGSEEMLGRLTELMFVEIIRQYLEELSAEQSGWLAGLRDPMIGKALSLMHGTPSCDWGLEDLARSVGASRSEFAERFASYVGLPPIQYLAKWRMQLATGLLTNHMNIASVAAEVGYGSEASFSRAFKKIIGMPPSVWRNKKFAASVADIAA